MGPDDKSFLRLKIKTNKINHYSYHQAKFEQFLLTGSEKTLTTHPKIPSVAKDWLPTLYAVGKQPSIPLINLGRKWTLNWWWYQINIQDLGVTNKNYNQYKIEWLSHHCFNWNNTRLSRDLTIKIISVPTVLKHICYENDNTPANTCDRELPLRARNSELSVDASWPLNIWLISCCRTCCITSGSSFLCFETEKRSTNIDHYRFVITSQRNKDQLLMDFMFKAGLLHLWQNKIPGLFQDFPGPYNWKFQDHAYYG